VVVDVLRELHDASEEDSGCTRSQEEVGALALGIRHGAPVLKSDGTIVSKVRGQCPRYAIAGKRVAAGREIGRHCERARRAKNFADLRA